MTVIGITGPTGAGKTTALNALRALGVEVLDADAVYHRLLRENEALKGALAAAFGGDILDERGQVDRKALAGKVYPDRLEELNAITHPFVVEEVCHRIETARKAGKLGAAVDAIALIESGLGEKCDVVVSVVAPLEERIRRIMARDGIDEDYARRRALAQKPDTFFRSHSDHTLENREGDRPEDFEERALLLFRALLE